MRDTNDATSESNIRGWKNRRFASNTLIHTKIPIRIHHPRSHPISLLLTADLPILLQDTPAQEATDATLRLLLNTFDSITALLSGSIIGRLADAARDGLVFLWCASGGFGFSGGAGSGVGVFATSRGFGASAGVNFGF